MADEVVDVLVDVVMLAIDVIETDDLVEAVAVELVDFVETLVVETLVLALVEDVVWVKVEVDSDVTFARSWREAKTTAANIHNRMMNRDIRVI